MTARHSKNYIGIYGYNSRAGEEYIDMYMDMYDDDDGTHVIIHVIITEHIIIVYSLPTISRLCECNHHRTYYYCL